MKIYLVRHGQSKANVSDNHNHAYAPLTDVGFIQAKRTANFFRNKKIGKIYSSDLVRARDTAEEISKAISSQIIFLKNLREVNKGIFEGRPRIEEEEAIKRSGKNPLIFKPEGGESYYDVYKRAKKFIQKLKKENIEEDILIVSHGCFIISFILLLLNMPLEEKKYFGVKNCSISVIEVDKKWKVKYFKINYLTHLVSQSPDFLSKNQKMKISV